MCAYVYVMCVLNSIRILSSPNVHKDLYLQYFVIFQLF